MSTPVRVSWWLSFGQLLAVCISSVSLAGGPVVTFDAPPLIACGIVRNQSPAIDGADFADTHDQDRLVEAEIDISTLVTVGRAADLSQLLLRVVDPANEMAVVEYEPKTTLFSDVVKHVTVEDRVERERSAGISLSGKFEQRVSANGTAGASDRNTTAEKYARLPQLAPLVVSGTMHRGCGVYFKLRPSTQQTLEGARKFVVRFRVPASWQGGLLHVRCEAFAEKQKPPLDQLVGRLPIVESDRQEVVVGRRDFQVVLYADGNPAAKANAKRLVRASQRLTRELSLRKHEIEESAYENHWHEIRAHFHASKRIIPRNWLSEMLAQRVVESEGGTLPYEKHLPAALVASIDEYRAARHELTSTPNHSVAKVPGSATEPRP